MMKKIGPIAREIGFRVVGGFAYVGVKLFEITVGVFVLILGGLGPLSEYMEKVAKAVLKD